MIIYEIYLKWKIFLLKLDKNQNCRSFTHESLAIPRSDHHSHSLFGLMGLVVVGGVGRVGVKGPEYENSLTAVGDGGADLTPWRSQNGLRLILSNFWTPARPFIILQGERKSGTNSQKWDFYWKSRFSIFFYFLKMEGIFFHLSVTLLKIFSKLVFLFCHSVQ